MNGNERIMTARERGRPDTVPIWELVFNEEGIINIARHFMDDDALPEPYPVRVSLVLNLPELRKELQLEENRQLSAR